MMEKKIPEGYKKTEVGVIPEDWEVKNLDEVGELFSGLTYSPNNVNPFGTLVLRSSNIQNNKLSYLDNVFVEMNLPDSVIVEENDILICVRNGSRHLIGKCTLIDSKAAGSAFGAFMSVFRAKSPIFLFYQFQSNVIQRQINKSLGATINQITNKDFSSFKIVQPTSKKEQQIIADTLSDVDNLITSLEQLIEKKSAIKQGAMQELLTGKKRLPGFGKNKGYKQTELGLIPDDWVIKNLGELGSFTKGYNIPKDKLTSTGVPCIIYGEIYTRYNFLVSKLFSKIPKDVASKAKEINHGDILFAGSGETAEDIGKCVSYLGSSSAYAGGDVIIFSPKNLDSRLLGYLLNSSAVIKQKSSLGQGSSVVHIYPNNLKMLELLLPQSRTEQSAIASILSDMDSEIENLEKKVDKYKQIKQGMMQNLLTGKIRLI